MKNQILEKSIVGEVRLSYSKTLETHLSKIKCSEDIVAFIREIFPVEQINHREYVYAIFLDRANQILGYFMVSSGGISGTVVDPRIIFQSALLSNASGIVIFHNHPSNNLTPSKADIEITTKIAKGGRILDITLLDHIIISENGYYSFADEERL